MSFTSTQFIELAFHFEVDIEPFRKGQYTGPPELCCPDEGGTATITGASIGTQAFSREAIELLFTPEALLDIEEEAYEEWRTSGETA